MPSLTHVAAVARKTINYTGIGLVAYIVLQFGIVQAIALYRYLYPPPPPPPTVGFGALPKLIFPANPGYSFEFILQTPTGTFPTFSDRASVYFIPYQRANLLASDQAKQLAAKMGFIGEPQALSADTYEWRATIPSPLTLTTNIVDGSFNLVYQWQTDPGLLTQRQLLSNTQALSVSQQFFERSGLFHSDIDLSQGKLSFLKASGNRLVPAVSLSEAHFVRVDYFRNPITQLPIGVSQPDPKAIYPTIGVVTPNPDEGIISITVSGTQDALKQIVEVIYNYFPVNYLSGETYPLKPVALAWEELKKGGGYIAKNESQSRSLTVRRIELVYYDTPTAQQYLQPVYMFTGDDGGNKKFVAYVPAVNSEWIKEN